MLTGGKGSALLRYIYCKVCLTEIVNCNNLQIEPSMILTLMLMIFSSLMMLH